MVIHPFARFIFHRQFQFSPQEKNTITKIQHLVTRRGLSEKEGVIGRRFFMLSSASTRRNKRTATTSSVPALSNSKRKLRTSRDMKRRAHRRQNWVLGIFIVAITFLFVSLGLFNNANANKINLENLNLELDKNLRGASEERSIWVSQNSQPFVSPCG